MDFGDEAHRIILEFDYSYLNPIPANDMLVDVANQRLYGGMREIITDFIAQKTVSSKDRLRYCYQTSQLKC